MTLLKFQELIQPEFLSFVKHLFNRHTSSFIIIFGRRETGKTNLAFILCETLFYGGIIKNISTNVRIISAPFKIEHITNLFDLEEWCKETRGRKLLLLDELGKAFKRRTPMKSLNIKIIDKLQVLRKYKLSIIGCTPSPKYIDNVALGEDILDGVFTKLKLFKMSVRESQKRALYEDYLEGFGKSLKDIPKSSIDFDTWDIAPFTEFGAKKIRFQDDDLDKLWSWVDGGSWKEYFKHPMECNRFVRRMTKKLLELHSLTHSSKA